MAIVVRFAKTIRNNWKKSTFFALAAAYGINYTKEHFLAEALMKEYCLKAQKYGDESIPDGVNPKSITVILNPKANSRKAAKQFEKYCAPILHMAGICIDIQQTESEGHARTLIENLKNTDAIIVAGGDGTISEVITGLFRRTGNDRIENPCPIGILPLGRTNTIGKVLFPGGDTIATVKSLADASLAIVAESTKTVDVMKIEILDEPKAVEETSNVLEENVVKAIEDIGVSNLNQIPSEIETVAEIKPVVNLDSKPELSIEQGNDTSKIIENVAQNVVSVEQSKQSEAVDSTEQVPVAQEVKEVEVIPEKVEEKQPEAPPEPPKPVYALATFEWGAYRDALAKQDKYWYYGSLRKYATYIFNGYKNSLTWECKADIKYLEPCTGCSNCYVKHEEKKPQRRWWSRFFSKREAQKVQIDYSKIINERCSQQHHKEITTSDFTLTTVNVYENPDVSQLHLNIGPQSTEYLNFVKEGFKTLKGENRHFEDTIQARQIEILPKKLNPSQEVWFSIDKEEYEARPVRITLLPRVLKVYCRQPNTVQ